jgi:hypothetical protein
MVCPTSKLDRFNSPLVFVVFNWHRSLQPYPAPTLLHSSFPISKHFDRPDLKTNEVPPWRRSRPQSPLVEHIFWSLISKDPTFDFTYNPHLSPTLPQSLVNATYFKILESLSRESCRMVLQQDISRTRSPILTRSHGQPIFQGCKLDFMARLEPVAFSSTARFNPGPPSSILSCQTRSCTTALYPRSWWARREFLLMEVVVSSYHCLVFVGLQDALSICYCHCSSSCRWCQVRLE